MGYCENDSMVRVDFFKQSGKWHATRQMPWLQYTGCIQDIFRMSLNYEFGEAWKQFDVVCLEPHHENAHPLQFNARHQEET